MRSFESSIWSKAPWLFVVVASLATSMFAATQESVLYSFHPSGTDAAFPTYNGLIADASGNRYGLSYQGGAYDVGAVYELIPQQGGGWTEKLIHSFGHSGDGTYPFGSLVIDSAGNLYGTTGAGGSHGCGTAFEVTPHSNGNWTETVIHNFGSGSDGCGPQAGLIFDSHGNLYGTTGGGGTNFGSGTVFEMSPRQGGGWNETVLHNFGSGTDGVGPFAPLIFDGAGNLYGTTEYGGTCFDCGTIFQMRPRQGGGWTETVIHNFNNDGTDGTFPEQGLILDGNGNLFGAAPFGGANNEGVAFELSPRQGGGWAETILHTFSENGTDGGFPSGSLVRDSSGNLYGTAYGGGSGQSGVVFELSPAQGGGWTETILHSFTFNGTDGLFPGADLMLDGGNLFGTTGYGGIRNDATVFELSPRQGGGWTEAVLHSFIYSGSNGAFPFSGLIADSSGNLYGTAIGGGSYDSGIAFKLTPAGGGTWTETLLHNFGHGFDGTFPNAVLILDSNGNLYGTTESGGTHNCGAVFEISPHQGGGWTESVIHNFNCNGVDGTFPFGGLIFDGVGNLFGTTLNGGSHNNGTVFEMSPNGSGGWTERIVHNFNRSAGDGAQPEAGVLMDSSGNFFGTTLGGGAHHQGTVFEELPNGSGGYTERVLYSFDYNDGSQPSAGLVLDAAHNLYGTTRYGGDDGEGTVFQLTPQQNGTWTERVIYSFDGTYGSYPAAGLTFFGMSQDLYGTTPYGGANGYGTVFQLTPTQGGDWIISSLHDFNPATNDGGSPFGGLIFDASGNLYGTTEVGGGNYNAGTVFEITSVPGRPPR